MSGGTIWERELKWPQTGPIRWLSVYFAFVIFAGFAVWLILSLVSPTTPDLSSGQIYEVPGGRRNAPFYVDKFNAYGLRIAVGHLVVVVLVGGGFKMWNVGARVPKKLGEGSAGKDR